MPGDGSKQAEQMEIQRRELSLQEYERCIGVPRRSRLKGETEMFRKLPTVLAIAILLGAVSAAPALAQTRSHQGDHQSIGERPAVPFTRDYATQPDQGDRQSIDETT